MSTSRKTTWTRLSANWYKDPVLCTMAEQQPAVLQLWPVLIGMAKASSHYQHNPEGKIEATPRTIANESFLSVDVVEQCLELLAEGEMLSMDKSPYGLSIVLQSFTRWQTPNGSNAERLANRRWKKEQEAASASREKAQDGHANERVGHERDMPTNELDTSETCQDRDRDRDRDRENHHHLSSSSLNAASDVAHTVVADDDDVDSSEDVSEPDATIPTNAVSAVHKLDPTRSPTAHVAQTRRKLGKSALLVDELISQRVEHRGGKPMSPAEQYRKWYAPALELVTLFGRGVTDEALAAAVAQRATSITYARSVAAGIVDKNQRDDRTGNAKGMIAGPNRSLSVDELEKLMAEGLA